MADSENKAGEIVGRWLWRFVVAVFFLSLSTNVITIWILAQRQKDYPFQKGEIAVLRERNEALKGRIADLEQVKSNEIIIWRTNWVVAQVMADRVSNADRVYSDPSVDWLAKARRYQLGTNPGSN